MMRERKEAEEMRRREEEERRKRREELNRQKRMLEAAFDGELEEIKKLLKEVRPMKGRGWGDYLPGHQTPCIASLHVLAHVHSQQIIPQ